MVGPRRRTLMFMGATLVTLFMLLHRKASLPSGFLPTNLLNANARVGAIDETLPSLTPRSGIVTAPPSAKTTKSPSNPTQSVDSQPPTLREVSSQSPALIGAEETTFDRALARFVENHNKINQPGYIVKRFVTALVCAGPGQCPGFGDMIKATLSAFTLALILNRGFLIHAALDHDLWDVYEGEIDWRGATAHANGLVSKYSEISIDCWIKPCSCSLAYRNQLDIQVMGYVSGQDCSGYITRIPEFADRVRELGILEDGMWRTKVYEMLFKMKEPLLTPLRIILKMPAGVIRPTLDDYIRYVSHTRIGGGYMKDGVWIGNPNQPSDNPQEAGKDIRKTIQMYADCLTQYFREYSVDAKDLAVFAASDTGDALDILRTEYSKMGLRVVTGEAAGPLGHIYNVKGSYRRTYVEWEILRHAEVLLAGESGYSLMAYKLRARPNMIIYAAWDQCQWPFATYHVYAD